MKGCKAVAPQNNKIVMLTHLTRFDYMSQLFTTLVTLLVSFYYRYPVDPLR